MEQSSSTYETFMQMVKKVDDEIGFCKSNLKEAEERKENIRIKIKKVCQHPSRVDDRFPVCSVCYSNF